jgi:hypothetical protein
MDAGLIRKLNEQCKFLPVRYGLPVSALPPLLLGMSPPEITTDEDLAQLIHDIWGVGRKSPRGEPPTAVKANAETKMGYSAAATTIARLFVERTEHALFGDPQITISNLAGESGLSIDDTKGALYELSTFVKLSHDTVLPEGTLFAEFDRYWKPWNSAEDGLRLAADMINDREFPSACQEIAARYRWEPRQLNPAIHYLLERRLVVDCKALGTQQSWAIMRLVGNDQTRRFVKSRSRGRRFLAVAILTLVGRLRLAPDTSDAS